MIRNLSSSTQCDIDIEERRIVIKNCLITDTILVQWRVFPFRISQPQSILDSSIIQSYLSKTDIAYDMVQDEDKHPLFKTKNLDYDGSFSRGISFGSSQSLVLNYKFQSTNCRRSR